MARPLIVCARLAALALIVLLAAAAVAQEERYEKAPLDSFERFDGTLGVAPELAPGVDVTADMTEPRRLVIHNWIVPGGTEIERFPVEGFAVVQLRGGELVTVIGGERQERAEDEFWVIPAGATMAVETEDDSAVLQTIAVR